MERWSGQTVWLGGEMVRRGWQEVDSWGGRIGNEKVVVWQMNRRMGE